MLPIYKPKHFVLVDVADSRKLISQFASYLGLIEKNEIQLFIKNIFDIFLMNNVCCNQLFWDYIEHILQDKLEKFDLTELELLSEIILSSSYETMVKATGTDQFYKVANTATDIGCFEIMPTNM